MSKEVTVGELIGMLSTRGNGLRVVIYVDGHDFDIEEVWLDKSSQARAARLGDGASVVAIQLREIE